MKIDQPLYLLLLLLLLPLAGIAVRNYYQGRRTLLLLAGRAGYERFAAGYMIKCFFNAAAFLLFIVFSVLALLDISWGKAPVEEDRSGLDVISVFDVSRSMLARDVLPNRLAAAADLVRGVVAGLPSARIGALVFKGSAVNAVPLTEDRAVFESFLDQLNPSLARSPGTDLQAGLEKALEAFPPGSERHRVLLLLSDGEGLSGDPEGAARKAAELGIPIFTVGVGGREGATVKLADGTFLLGRNKKPLISRLNEDPLETIALVSQGKYFNAETSAVVARILEEIRSFEGTRGKLGFRIVTVHRYRLFLSPAFLFLLAQLIIRSRRWKGMY